MPTKMRSPMAVPVPVHGRRGRKSAVEDTQEKEKEQEDKFMDGNEANNGHLHEGDSDSKAMESEDQPTLGIHTHAYI